MASFTGWTATSIQAAAVEAYGSGWANDATKLASAQNAIYGAWNRVCAYFTPPSTVIAKTATTHPAWFNQLWFLQAMVDVATMIGALDTVNAAYFLKERDALLAYALRHRTATTDTAACEYS